MSKDIKIIGGSGKFITEVPLSVEEVLKITENDFFVIEINGKTIEIGRTQQKKKRKRKKHKPNETQARTLKAFRKLGIQCVDCSIKGEKFFLFLAPEGNYFIQLVAYIGVSRGGKNKYVVLTKDHILAKADGGSDQLSNYQIMCATCNSKKGSRKDDIETIIKAFYHRTNRYRIG